MKKLVSLFLIQSVLFCKVAFAGFPDDLSDVVFVHNDISSWPVTSSLSVNVTSTTIQMPYDKAGVWPSRNHPFCDGCNANPWIIANFDGTWYAATFEWFRFNQTSKPVRVVHGDHIKRSPFGTTWTPKNGETYGFMVSGLARFDDGIVSARERTNIVLYQWGEGPVGSIGPVTPPNTHVYDGRVVGEARGVFSGVPITRDFDEAIQLLVGNDRSVEIKIDGQTFNATLDKNNRFSENIVVTIESGCTPTVRIQGLVNGRNSSGTIVGSAVCTFSGTPFGDLTGPVSLNAIFSASSTTEPVFDEVENLLLTPVYQLLLD